MRALDALWALQAQARDVAAAAPALLALTGAKTMSPAAVAAPITLGLSDTLGIHEQPESNSLGSSRPEARSEVN